MHPRGGPLSGTKKTKKVKLLNNEFVLQMTAIILRRFGSNFGVAGVCKPFPYQLLTIFFLFPYRLLHVRNSQQDVRGAIFGLLVCVL